MLQVPYAAAQPMVGPLFRRGILCFERGIGGDVFRHIFGSDDFFGKQIKAEKDERKKHEAQDQAEEQGADQEETHFRTVRFFDEPLS
jgi:hypothetical protein